MSDKTQQAAEALHSVIERVGYLRLDPTESGEETRRGQLLSDLYDAADAIAALQAEGREAVGFITVGGEAMLHAKFIGLPEGTKLYTHPQSPTASSEAGQGECDTCGGRGWLDDGKEQDGRTVSAPYDYPDCPASKQPTDTERDAARWRFGRDRGFPIRGYFGKPDGGPEWGICVRAGVTHKGSTPEDAIDAAMKATGEG